MERPEWKVNKITRMSWVLSLKGWELSLEAAV
jgi:hypothetical protein